MCDVNCNLMLSKKTQVYKSLTSHQKTNLTYSCEEKPPSWCLTNQLLSGKAVYFIFLIYKKSQAKQLFTNR